MELGTLTQEQTHDLTLPLSGDHPGNYGMGGREGVEGEGGREGGRGGEGGGGGREGGLYYGHTVGTIHLLLTITGTAAHEVVEGDTVTTNNVSWRTTSAAEMRAKYVS